MKVRFLNCGLMHPRLAPLFVPHLDRVPCLCLLLEEEDRLVLVDTGFGTRDVSDPTRLGRFGAWLLNPRMDVRLTAREQVKRLGYDPDRVCDIVCTHLDRDHAGGLPDFPSASVHVLRDEMEAALSPRSARERERYRPCHFAHGPHWVAYDEREGEEWRGLMRIPLRGLPESLFLVPLQGHTRGHCGVLVETGEGWLLHCGDAYYVMEELREKGKAPVGVAGFRAVAHMSLPRALSRLERLRDLVGDVTLVASHDQFEYRSRFGRPLD
ncbi:MBL fold metallo-hydrolase [Candidatus Solincola tengchongensis]|uniref:MBL fold metallo-hydrolase n=1 Tax=Candidatus Solincola tengchongensis TaxID=2900693 RepID=UPI0025794900|nr:MBL fold metallo-hydrolase [Candidatus Solincola tengchongensis]